MTIVVYIYMSVYRDLHHWVHAANLANRSVGYRVVFCVGNISEHEESEEWRENDVIAMKKIKRGAKKRQHDKLLIVSHGDHCALTYIRRRKRSICGRTQTCDTARQTISTRRLAYSQQNSYIDNKKAKWFGSTRRQNRKTAHHTTVNKTNRDVVGLVDEKQARPNYCATDITSSVGSGYVL